MEENTYSELVVYLTENMYVSEATKEHKRRIREIAQSFFLNENALMHKGGKGRQQLRVINRAEVQELVQQMHASVVGGCHFGINDTHRQHQKRASQSTVLSQFASGFAAAPPNAVMIIHAPEH